MTNDTRKAVEGQRSEVTSLTLLEQVKAGDERGWQRLVSLYTPLVYHWCGRWSVRGADADDVLQEVFGTAAARIADFRRERPGDTFRGWLRGITRNKLLDQARRRGNEPQARGGSSIHEWFAEVPASEALERDDPADAQAITDLFHRALDNVRGEFEIKTWKLFWRSAVEGAAARDVAQELGVSVESVRTAKCRILRRLREEVGDAA